MTKEEFLKIFDLTERYEKRKDIQNFTLSLSDYMLISGTHIIFYFMGEEIHFSFSTKDFIPGNEEKNIYMEFYPKDNKLMLRKDNSFKNELFEHLFFEEGIIADLEFLAGITKNILIPKYNLRWEYFKI